MSVVKSRKSGLYNVSNKIRFITFSVSKTMIHFQIIKKKYLKRIFVQWHLVHQIKAIMITG